MKNKRGLSNIVATILIILLSLAAIAIVWAILAPVLRGSSTQIELNNLCLNTEVKPLGCSGTTGTSSVSIQLVRGEASKIAKLVAVLEFDDGSIETAETTTIPSLLGSTSVQVTVPAGKVAQKAKASAIVTNGERELTCNPTEVTAPCS